jgi:molybdopterin-biosynthesis enzyme MoeA-like protein
VARNGGERGENPQTFSNSKHPTTRISKADKMSESQIGDYLNRFTDDEKSFAQLSSRQANAFLRFAGEWLRITGEENSEHEYDRLRAMLQAMTQFTQPRKALYPEDFAPPEKL